MAQQPNILYIHSHDTGRYVQPYGRAVGTPNIQRLAEQGVLFRRAFCAAPTCSPSRAALLTGQSAHSSGMIGLAHRGFRLRDYRRLLSFTLADARFHTALVGVQHVATDRSILGYHELLKAPSASAADVAPEAVRFLRQGPPQPFFLDVGFFETHREFPTPGPEDDPRYCPPAPTVPDTPDTRRDMAAFRASARALDRGVGTVLQALDEAGLAENTLVICTTDHGIAFPGMKCNLTDHGIGVMLIMRGPEGFAGGRVCDAMVSHIDVYPTVCGLLGLEPAPWLEGRSLLPIVRGEADEVNEEVFAEVTYHAAYEPQRAVRTHRWKYIRRFGGRQTPVLPNCDDSPSKDVWMNHGWAHRRMEQEQLYDLVFDPGEVCNLADDPTYRDVLADMRSRLQRWMEKTEDPLLLGDVPAPPGAEVNDPNGVSPQEPTLRVR